MTFTFIMLTQRREYQAQHFVLLLIIIIIIIIQATYLRAAKSTI